MTLDQILQVLQSAGVIGLLAMIVWGGYKQWYVFGWQYREAMERVEQERQEGIEWKDLALRSVATGERVAEVAAAAKHEP